MERICVIGGSGTGKTTLSENLAHKLNLPVYHIDGINYLDNWVQRDTDERDKMILEIVEQEKWIIDGTYRSTLDKRLERADYIIYLDYSSFAQIKGVFERYFKNGGKEKEEIKGCKEQMNWTFFWFVLTWRKRKRKEILSKINNVDSNKVHIFKNRRELNKWYENQFGEKMNI